MKRQSERIRKRKKNLKKAAVKRMRKGMKKTATWRIRKRRIAVIVAIVCAIFTFLATDFGRSSVENVSIRTDEARLTAGITSIFKAIYCFDD